MACFISLGVPGLLAVAGHPFSLNPLITPVSMADRLHQAPDLILGALELSLSIAFLSLYWVARDFRVFRILSLFYVLLGLEQFMEYSGADPVDWTLRALAVGVIVEVAGQALSIRNRRWTRIFWPVYVLVFVGAWIPPLRGLRDFVAASEIPLAILIYQGFRRGGRTERMIGVALTLHFLVRITIIPTVARFTGGSNFMVVGGWRFRLTALTLTVLGATTLIVFAQALMRDRAEKHRLATEFESARAVQQVLVPEEIPAVAGFEIAAVYRPFGEVGGDFFQILPVADGVLVVIGDVSGKGMPAAMMVSLLVGTVRTLAHYTQSPGEILAAMNARMIGRSNGGFTTCLVLRADSNGTLTVANAGHIAPYLAGRELGVESGLPLGLAADVGYAEATFTFGAGERLTLVTDGVVEARAKGGELLGFERTAEMSVGTAEAIAEAAQAFGQDDDVTVLTVARAGAEDPHFSCAVSAA
jgi:hypothetical protein